MNEIQSTKSLLAKLLASENITVEHGNYQTASFDVKNRVIRLPIFKYMSGPIYDLMVLHEVGHALWTPLKGLHSQSRYLKCIQQQIFYFWKNFSRHSFHV